MSLLREGGAPEIPHSLHASLPAFRGPLRDLLEAAGTGGAVLQDVFLVQVIDMRKKMTKDESTWRDSGSHAAFMESAEKCREAASLAFLNHQDEAANALRELVAYFLDQAAACQDVDDS